MLSLIQFRDLIAAMPTNQHASTGIQRRHWKAILDRQDAPGAALRALFTDRQEIAISRADLRQLGQAAQLDQFVMATILWGYPVGMRGHHVDNLCQDFPALLGLLQSFRVNPITDWQQYWDQVGPIRGIGLSTITKFLCFLGGMVSGYGALILDRILMLVTERGIFSELVGRFDERNYPEYLARMHGAAVKLSVPAENLEYFLYEFGLNLKG